MRGKHILPRTIDGMKHVCYFRHALALDERRVKFQPEYAYGGLATKPEDRNTPTVGGGLDRENVLLPESEDSPIANNGSPDTAPSTTNETVVNHPRVKKDPMERPQIMEVWFAGTHSDM
jgi:hypothetical protein